MFTPKKKKKRVCATIQKFGVSKIFLRSIKLNKEIIQDVCIITYF